MTAASSGEKPSTVWKKMEVRKTVPAKMAVTPSMTVVPATGVTTFQVCGATRGRRARRSMIAKRCQQHRRQAQGGQGAG